MTTWSFLMASAHGAGLMVLPFVMPVPRRVGGHATNTPLASVGSSSTAATNAIAVGIHTLAYLVVMALAAWVVYRKVGLGFLRKAWFNVDWVWAGALVVTGLIVLLKSPTSICHPPRGGTVRQSRSRFIRQQGFSAADSKGLYSGLMFQPRIIGCCRARCAAAKPVVFLTLSALLFWSAFVPAYNPFDAIYNVSSHTLVVLHRSASRPSLDVSRRAWLPCSRSRLEERFCWALPLLP